MATLKRFLTIILSFFQGDGLSRAHFCTDGVSHVSTAVALDRHFCGSRGIDDPEGADHHTHPAGDTGWFVHINQTRFRVFAHGPVGAGLQTGGLLTMPALQGKRFPFHIDPGHRTGFFVDGGEEFLGDRGDFGSTPELTLMASRTFIFIDDQNFHFLLLIYTAFKVGGSLRLRSTSFEVRIVLPQTLGLALRDDPLAYCALHYSMLSMISLYSGSLN
jgi:hypothetical protein